MASIHNCRPPKSEGSRIPLSLPQGEVLHAPRISSDWRFSCGSLPARLQVAERTTSTGVARFSGRRKQPRVELTDRLEESRFIAWQLYGFLAGGSRERLELWQFYGRCTRRTEQTRWAKNALGHSREPPAANR